MDGITYIAICMAEAKYIVKYTEIERRSFMMYGWWNSSCKFGERKRNSAAKIRRSKLSCNILATLDDCKYNFVLFNLVCQSLSHTHTHTHFFYILDYVLTLHLNFWVIHIQKLYIFMLVLFICLY